MVFSANSIFIVEDDPDDRQIILDAFLEVNVPIEFVFIENGNELLDILNKPGVVLPSLIVLDLNMPGPPGLQVLKKIKEDKKTSSIPIVILTTSVKSSDKEVSYELGVNCFVAKPETFSELTSIARSIIQLWFPGLLNNAGISESISSMKKKPW